MWVNVSLAIQLMVEYYARLITLAGNKRFINMLFTKRFLLKIIPVYLTGAYLMWLIYFISDQTNMKPVNILIVKIGLFQLSIIGAWLYYSQYRGWHTARELLEKGVPTKAEITQSELVSLNLFATQHIRLTYQFKDELKREYSNTQLYFIRQVKKWFNGALPKVGDTVDIFYNPDKPDHTMLSQAVSYGKTSSTF